MDITFVISLMNFTILKNVSFRDPSRPVLWAAGGARELLLAAWGGAGFAGRLGVRELRLGATGGGFQAGVTLGGGEQSCEQPVAQFVAS